MSRIEDIPIKKIVSIVPNHRQAMDGDKLTELAGSMNSIGLQQPIKVAEHGGKYCIVYGHRRLEAARQLEWKTIPAIIETDWDDQAIAEAQVVENIHREDLNPIEEAHCVKTLIDAGHDLEMSASKLGKSLAWARSREHLLRLTDDVSVLVASGRIPLGHAKLLARVGDKKRQEELASSVCGDHDDFVIPLRDLRRLIQYIDCKMGAAYWPKDTEYAGFRPCLGCPDNTESDPLLFDDLKIERTSKKGNCLNPTCYKAKAKAWEKDPVKIARDKAREEKKAKDGKPAKLTKSQFKSMTPEDLQKACKEEKDYFKSREIDSELQGRFPWNAEQKHAVAMETHFNELVDILINAIRVATIPKDHAIAIAVVGHCHYDHSVDEVPNVLDGLAVSENRVRESEIAEGLDLWIDPPMIEYDGREINIPISDKSRRKIDSLRNYLTSQKIEIPQIPSIEDAVIEDHVTAFNAAKKADLQELLDRIDEDRLTDAVFRRLWSNHQEGKAKYPAYKIAALKEWDEGNPSPAPT